MPPPERVVEQGARLAKELEAAISIIQEPELREAALAYPRAGGKALRPALAVLSCEATGGELETADPLALSVELLHTFSLVHDDLMDDDELRRGVPAVHVAYDDASAILAGDVLYALSFEVLSRLGQAPWTAAVLEEVARTARVLCEGQHLDMVYEGRWPTVEEYEGMIAKKTAALFACATSNGARIAGAGAEVVEAMDRFGHALGMGFQIQDDILDLVGDPERLGKPVGSDVLAGKKSHPLLAAHQAASPEDRDRLDAILDGQATEADIAWVLELCETTDALSTSRARARAWLDEARQALDALDQSPATRDLAGLVDWLETRDR